MERDKKGLGDTPPRVRYIVGNDRRVQFWKDAGCGEAAVCTMFPSLFALVAHKEGSMADVWDSSRDTRAVVPSLHQNP